MRRTNKDVENDLESPFLNQESFASEEEGSLDAQLHLLEAESPFLQGFARMESPAIAPEPYGEAFGGKYEGEGYEVDAPFATEEVEGEWEEGLLEGYGSPPTLSGVESEIVGSNDMDGVANHLATPFRWICRLDIEYEITPWNSTGKLTGSGRGSGTLISPCHILTAAHNISTYDPAGRNFLRATRIRVTAAHDSSNRPPVATVEANMSNLRVHPLWRVADRVDGSGNSNGAGEVATNRYDYALITLARAIDQSAVSGGRLGYWARQGSGGTALFERLDPNVLSSNTVSVTGYGYDDCVRDARQARSKPNIPLGSQLTASGQITLIWEGRQPRYVGRSMAHNVDSCGGQSGAPVWLQRNGVFYLVGIHTGGVGLTGGGRTNHAVRVTTELITQVNDWMARTPCPQPPAAGDREALFGEESSYLDGEMEGDEYEVDDYEADTYEVEDYEADTYESDAYEVDEVEADEYAVAEDFSDEDRLLEVETDLLQALMAEIDEAELDEAEIDEAGGDYFLEAMDAQEAPALDESFYAEMGAEQEGGALDILPSWLRENVKSGTLTLQAAWAMVTGQRDANTLTNMIFYARHPELPVGYKIKPNEKQLAASWVQIRDGVVKPILQRLMAGGTVTGGGTTGTPQTPLANLPLKITVEKEITLASRRKRIAASRLLKVFARLEGKAKLSVETIDNEKNNVELKIGKEAELKINDLFLGASGAFTVSKDKVEFKLGIEEFEVSIQPSLTNPIAFHVPAISLPVAGQVFRLEKEIPALGLTGKAEIEVEFVIEVLPNYRELAKVLKPSNVRAALQVAKNKLYTVTRKGKAVGAIVVKAGRAAIYAPFKWLGNKIGKRLAIDALKLGSQSAALRKLLGRAGKLLGAAGIVLETWLIVRDAIPKALMIQHNRTIDPINLNFVPGYTRFLATYTAANAQLTDSFFEGRVEIERLADAPPDMYGVIETFAKTGNVPSPNKNAGAWRDDKVANGLKYRKETVTLSEVDWQAQYREAYNIYFIFEDAAQNASNQKRKATAQEATNKALKQAVFAGQVAAYQDILAFVVNTSLGEDQQGKQPTDLWEEWQNVAEFHRAVFGEDLTTRHHSYLQLIDPKTLTVSIPPFGDYADWSN